jgi:hypothetical protein
MTEKIILKSQDKEYIIKVPSPFNQKNVWIETQDGEGSDFATEDFFDVVDKFYREKF